MKISLRNFESKTEKISANRISDIELHGDWQGFIVIDSKNRVKESDKKMIRNCLLTATTPIFKETNPRFDLVISCYIDGAFIDFLTLSKKVKEQILDDILYKNRTYGEFVEYAQIVKDEEDDTSFYSAIDED